MRRVREDPERYVLLFQDETTFYRQPSQGWRWTRQRVVHAHPWCDDFGEFREQVRGEFDRLSDGSEEFLRYVGLSIELVDDHKRVLVPVGVAGRGVQTPRYGGG